MGSHRCLRRGTSTYLALTKLFWRTLTTINSSLPSATPFLVPMISLSLPMSLSYPLFCWLVIFPNLVRLNGKDCINGLNCCRTCQPDGDPLPDGFFFLSGRLCPWLGSDLARDPHVSLNFKNRSDQGILGMPAMAMLKVNHGCSIRWMEPVIR